MLFTCWKNGVLQLQPPVIEPIQFIPAAPEGESDHVGTDLAETIVSSKPNSPTTQNIEIPEPSIISNLESHYSGELCNTPFSRLKNFFKQIRVNHITEYHISHKSHI